MLLNWLFKSSAHVRTPENTEQIIKSDTYCILDILNLIIQQMRCHPPPERDIL